MKLAVFPRGPNKLIHVYELRPRKDERGFNLISDVLLFGRLWYTQVSDDIDYAEHYGRVRNAVVRVYNYAAA